MQLLLIIGISIAIGSVLFALQNNLPVVVTLALWSFEGSLALVLLIAMGLGALIAGFLSSPAMIRRQWRIARLRSQTAELEKQLVQQQRRNRELEEELARLIREPAAVADQSYVGPSALLADAGTEDSSARR
jgi:uncharacterized integral membrane protein